MKDLYLKGLQAYHKKIERVLQKNYGIEIEFLDVIGWGHTTTAYFIKTPDKNYVARVSKYSKQKLKAIKKDIALSNELNTYIPTTKYRKNNSDNFITLFDDKILRLSEHINGLFHYDMDDKTLSSAVKMLHKIHQLKPNVIDLAKVKNSSKHVFLHGDLTPANIIQSYSKVTGILDFEMALYGPPEWDLAITAVFSWLKMKNTEYLKIYGLIKKNYKDKIDKELFMKYSVKHLKTYHKNIQKNKNKYKHLGDYKLDVERTYNKLKELSKL
ncbi:MAG TPA: aminoglycoside phosphotransferase family protein [Candidatus Saccharimonadales bacterium]|nr:aminoglycoside phosphotransferase family protein [Candidatus Saccharimonadales bacterium]